MKTLAIFVIACLSFGTIRAQQKIEKHMNLSENGKVELKIEIADSISIQTWNKNEVYVTASINVNDNKDNEAYLTSFDETGNIITINGNFRKNYFSGRDNCCNKTDIFWQVFVPVRTNVSAETINGDLTIRGETGNLTLKTISGYIDLSVPETRSADLEFSTISGTVYSNHNFNPEKMKTGIPMKIREKMNNGGQEIKLETISGDIFFRKSD